MRYTYVAGSVWCLIGIYFFFGHTERHTELSLPGLDPTPSAVEAQS